MFAATWPSLLKSIKTFFARICKNYGRPFLKIYVSLGTANSFICLLKCQGFASSVSFNVIEMFIFLVNDLSVFNSIVMSFHQKNKFFFMIAIYQIYISISSLSVFYQGDNFQCQILIRAEGQKKMSAWEDLKSSSHGYLPGRLTMFLVKKGF